MREYTIAILFTLTSLFTVTQAQPDNDLCTNAALIANPLEYCSGNTEWTTLNAKGTGIEGGGCFTGDEADVWFSFTAIGSAVNIVVNGDLGGSLNAVRVVLYEASCEELPSPVVACEAQTGGSSIVNLLQEGLIVGQTYLIRIGGSGSNQGSFQLCLNNFNPPSEPGQDANTAAVLCDKSGFVIQALSGGGLDEDEAAGSCLDVGFGSSENQSSWTAWIADNNGDLTFTITPINSNDDIDFVVYELPNGVNDFTGKIELRCMASSCNGPTGLSSTATDLTEAPGCGPGDDNFVRAIQQEEGKAYALLINNFSNTGVGISLTFGGSAEFQGPVPDFILEVEDAELTCDKVIDFIDDSENELGTIVALEWNFGEDATPATASGEGPFDVNYSTFGPKFVTLTITSDLGCKITEIREIEISPCCEDASALNIDIVNQQNIGCGSAETGSFSIVGSGGLPDYLYKFEEEEYGSQTFFDNLIEGDYEVMLLDRKGCEISRIISILEVNPVTVDAGEDLEVEFLGDSIQLSGSFEATSDVTVSWMPADNLFCEGGGSNCLNPTVIPSGTTTYIMSVSDAEGCTAADDVIVEVLKIRPLFAANVFSPNEDGMNDIFFLSGNPMSVSNILELNVYDRWGNQVYAGRNLSLNNINSGWNGTVDGSSVKEGVYVWYAIVELLDPDTPTMTIIGDVTLIR